ncbi:motility quorum-sensing regulator/GCU-specific mRNA interferase toxin [Rhizobium skierniewicense]|uniref:Motility quorum-sensing regulator/GCU-specific mRNA interferase toxin n=1 Tax=Rhizobium skierniewicense TaxID=984260 RepID=A0A7W6G472_9HYPH|nr:type II toxin-antitoxin system MqsR family toxin [Rhizobium skierniewicense]MBB3947196.1 motility quorum-sensing regulator/GCU-specific mRNA interferase toxin [Rhizobium skierniewicense]
MEKRRAHYNLKTIIAIVKHQRAAVFTKTAIDGGRRMDLTVGEMINVICELNTKCLYKSMTTYNDNTVWQDVYHADTPGGRAYIKLTLRTNGALVIQFKELES